jgi:hypothetical protein
MELIGMAQRTKSQTKTWTKPELNRLGKLADVAGGQPNPIQNVNNS